MQHESSRRTFYFSNGRLRVRDEHIMSNTLRTPAEIAAIPMAFTGELMRCVLCGREERSDPDIESQWRCLDADGRRHYVCPNEFPPDGASAADFREAYLRVFNAIARRRN